MTTRLLLYTYASLLTILLFAACKKDKKPKPGDIQDQPTPSVPASTKVYKTFTVPTQYATIQAAIDAAGEHDTIKVLAGRYQERVVINKSVNIVGAGSDKTQIALSGDLAVPSFEEVILVHANTPVNVSVSGLEIVGGNWNEVGYYEGSTRYGIHTKSSKIILKDIVVNSIGNIFVLIKDSEANIDGMKLFTRNILAQADVGVEIINSKAVINRLENTEPQIDHVIDINLSYLRGSDTDFSDVTITNCQINTSLLHWGDGIRGVENTKLLIDNCSIVRNPKGALIPTTSSFNGIQLDNINNTVIVRNTVIDGLPVGISITPGQSPAIIAERNIIKNCKTGVWINTWDRETVDFGGGVFGSRGQNTFWNNQEYDMRILSSANVSALSNQWSDNSNPSNKIWDKADDPALGKVSY